MGYLGYMGSFNLKWFQLLFCIASKTFGTARLATSSAGGPGQGLSHGHGHGGPGQGQGHGGAGQGQSHGYGHGGAGQGLSHGHGHFESGHGGGDHPLGDDFNGEGGLWCCS